MADSFSLCVDAGLELEKRLNYRKERAQLPPDQVDMHKSSQYHSPTAPMMYAMISDPGIVDNPDNPSYQPRVYGRYDPPALIPLQMNEIDMDIDYKLCYALVTVRAVWRIHCVMMDQCCDCLLAVPVGKKASVVSVVADIPGKRYWTELTKMEKPDIMKSEKNDVESFLNPQIFSLTIPSVNGGSTLAMKINWCQEILYADDQFSLSIPFNFPGYLTSYGKRVLKLEKIRLNIYTLPGLEISCDTASHHFKDMKRHSGTVVTFSSEKKVERWSSADFFFQYKVSTSDFFGGLILQSPSVHDLDQGDMFFLYLFPGNNHKRKVLRREVVFVVDISGSMQGKPLDNVKNSLSEALCQMNPEDSFNIITFNDKTQSFSSSSELATKETVERATLWLRNDCMAGGGTNILQPLDEVMDILSHTGGGNAEILLITDGAVDNERSICEAMRIHLNNWGNVAPRISTFGIGLFCNHYFLRMLSLIGGGNYDAAYDIDDIGAGIKRLIMKSSSAIFTNISINGIDHHADSKFPSRIPDLCLGYPLFLSGRYKGKCPNSAQVQGLLADNESAKIDLHMERTNDTPVDRVFVKQQIDILTAQAWYLESNQIKDHVMRMSLQNGVPSEYTCMALLQDSEKYPVKSVIKEEMYIPKLLCGFGVGFGNLKATSDNILCGFQEGKISENHNGLNCCCRLCDCACCMYCIRACTYMNDTCITVVMILGIGSALTGCLSLCYD